MENKTKRFLKVALVLMLVVAMLPQITIGAKAADTADTVTAYCEHKSHNQNGICAIEGCGVAVGHTYDQATGLCACGAKEAPKSDAIAAYTSATTIWGQTWSNARESYAIKVLDASDNVMGTSTLNRELYTDMNGNVAPTWHITLPGNEDPDKWWIQEWTIAPTLDNMPAKVELWIDGVKTSESAIQLNGPDGIDKIVAAIAGADGKLLTSYATTFAAALTAAPDNGTVKLLSGPNVAISAAGEVTGNKTVTVTGTAKFDWGKGWLMVGRGNNPGDGKLIFKDATITSASSATNTALGFNISGAKKNDPNTCNGSVEFINSNIETDYLLNAGNMTVDGGNLYVHHGFKVSGRDASDSASGEDATATMTVTNGAVVKIKNENTMGIGYEGNGILNLKDSTFICNSNFAVYKEEGSSFNISGDSTVKVAAFTRGGKVTIANPAIAEGETIKVIEQTDANAASLEGKVTVENLPAGTTVSYNDGDVTLVRAKAVATIGEGENEARYFTLAAALSAAKDGETITLISGPDVAISAAGAVYGKTVTITGTAQFDWTKDWLFVGRGGEGDGKLIFKDATITAMPNGGRDHGFHVSGREKETTNKYNGTLVIEDSSIEVDYLINRGNIEVNNSSMTVLSGFGIAGRPASETENNEPATATITIKNGSYVKVLAHSGMGVGVAASEPEGYGILNLVDSTFECENFNVDADMGEFNVSGTSTVKINTLTGIVKLDNVTLNNSTIGGQAQVYGTCNIGGTTTINRLDVGYGNYSENPVTANITGNFETGNLLISASSTANIGAADGEKTYMNAVSKSGQFGNSANANVENAEVYYTYLFTRGTLNVTDSTMNSTHVNTFISGANCVVTLDNSTWNAPSGWVDLGAYGSQDCKEGNATFILKNNSTLNASNLNLHKYDDTDYVVKLQIEDSAVNVANAVKVMDVASIEMNIGSTITAKSLSCGTGSNITIDATNLEAGKEYPVINLSGTESLEGKVTFGGDVVATYGADGDVTIEKAVAKVGNTCYTSVFDAVKASTVTDTITLLADAELDYVLDNPYQPERTINAAVIDLNSKTLTLTNTDLRFSDVTIKNGNIVVDPNGTYNGTGIFYMFGKTLTFESVKIDATGVASNSLIDLETSGGKASKVVLKDSELVINNEESVDSNVVTNWSNGDIVIDNSKVQVNNINGRVFLNGNFTVKNGSDIDASGVKGGFYLSDGQTLDIQDTSTVDITNLIDGKVNGIELNGTATYTKAETATVNATHNGVAMIGDTHYATLDKALAAAKNGDTVTVISDLELTTSHNVPAGVTLTAAEGVEIILKEHGTIVANGTVDMAITTAEGDRVYYDKTAGIYKVVDTKVELVNMTLEDSFSLNFWVKKSELKDSTVYTAKLTDENGNELGIVDIASCADDSEFFYVSYPGLAAKEMTRSITMQVFANGVAVSNPVTDSLKANAEWLIENTNDEALKIAMIDMLNYGAAAQKEFGYNTGNLANSGLTAEQQALATKSYDLPNAWANADGIGYGSNLELKNEIILHVWFKAANVAAIKVNGVEVGPEKITPRIGNSIMSVAVTDLAVADGFDTVTVEFFDASGNSLGTVTESVASYLKYMLSKSDDTNGLYDATAKFITSSYNYFK